MKFLDRENKKKLRLVNGRFDDLVVNLDKSFKLWTAKAQPFSEKYSKPGSVNLDSLIEDLLRANKKYANRIKLNLEITGNPPKVYEKLYQFSNDIVYLKVTSFLKNVSNGGGDELELPESMDKLEHVVFLDCSGKIISSVLNKCYSTIKKLKVSYYEGSLQGWDYNARIGSIKLTGMMTNLERAEITGSQSVVDAITKFAGPKTQYNNMIIGRKFVRGGYGD